LVLFYRYDWSNKIIIKYLTSIYSVLITVLTFSISYPQAPYKLDAGRETAVFSGGILLGLVDIHLINKKIPIDDEELSNISRDNINAFDRGATYNWSQSASEWSNILLITAIASPLTLFFSSTVRNDAGTFSTMYLQNILVVYSFAHLPKGIVTRYRPYVYNENVPYEVKQNVDATHSFLSAHTAVAFASAVFLSTTFDKYTPDSNLKPYIWTSSLLFASTVGYLRYVSGQHFPTDIITGAVIGSIIGYLIPLIHESNKENSELIVPAGNSYNNLVSFSINF